MKIKAILNKFLVFALTLVVAFGIVGCGGNKTNPSITITPSATTIMKGETVTLNVTFSNFEEGSSEKMIWEISDESLISIKDNKVSCLKKVVTDTDVTITGYAFADTSVKGVVVITVKAESADPGEQTWGVNVTLADTELEIGESTTVTVECVNTPSENYTITVSEPTLITVSGNTLTVVDTKTVDKIVTVTVTIDEDNTYVGYATLTVKAPIVDGQVGELTSAMLEEIGNASITVYGTLTDYYQDVETPSNNQTNNYYMEVMMEPDMWYGTWYAEGHQSTSTTNTFKKGSVDGVKDQYGNVGHTLNQLYVSKDNVVCESAIIDYISRPTLWEQQHYWNHLSQLTAYLAAGNIKFTYDAVNEVYVHTVDVTDEDDLYLMTYLSYSLTPLLSDTLESIYLTVEDGHITKLSAQTEILYYCDDEITTAEYAEEISYTTIELRFADIGTTKVPQPEVYEAPQNAEYLTNAIENMQNATNYTFSIVENATTSPSYDDDDYSLDSASSVSKKEKVSNTRDSSGTVGTVGYVTESAILLGETGKYEYAMDDNVYFTEWEGYVQNEDSLYGTPTYEYFENKYYDSESTYHLTGTQLCYGNISEILPTYVFSANIFEFSGTGLTTDGDTTYIFTLRSSDITNDVTREMAFDSYGRYGSSSTTMATTITVDGNGHIISVTFPYNIIDTWLGYYTISYGKWGTTTLPEDTFDDYVHRVVKKSWAEFTVSDYSPAYTTQSYQSIDAESLLQIIIGEDYTKMASPEIFIEVFGDVLYGPWFDWDNKGTDEEPDYRVQMDFNIRVSLGDENGQLSDDNFQYLISQLSQRLERLGFAISYANTDTSGGEKGTSDRYVTWINGDVQIVLQNNHTRYFFFTVYKTGTWTLNK